MKSRLLIATVSVLASVAVLAGCGGGGDAEAGSPTAFSVVPSSHTQTARTAANGGPAAGLCESSGGEVGTFFIYGGVAPYRLDNTAGDRIQLSTSEVSDRGGSFSVIYVTSACFTNATIVIVDKLDHQITLTLNNSPAGG